MSSFLKHFKSDHVLRYLSGDSAKHLQSSTLKFSEAGYLTFLLLLFYFKTL